MARQLDRCRMIERSITKKYRKALWGPFITAVTQYELIAPGDRIAVCISGGKDSMCMAKLMQMLHRITKVPFEPVFLVMDPGYYVKYGMGNVWTTQIMDNMHAKHPDKTDLEIHTAYLNSLTGTFEQIEANTDKLLS